MRVSRPTGPRIVLPPDVAANIVRRYRDDQISVAALAAECGVHNRVITRTLREHGVEIRGPRDVRRPPPTEASKDACREADNQHHVAVYRLPPLNPADPRPKPVQVAHYLRHAIATREFRQGKPLPTVQQMARHWRMGAETVVRGVQILIDEGLVAKVNGRLFVRGMPPDRRPAPEP